jgi:hypothetical protein
VARNVSKCSSFRTNEASGIHLATSREHQAALPNGGGEVRSDFNPSSVFDAIWPIGAEGHLLRWQRLTGCKAELPGDDHVFDDIAAARQNLAAA